MPPHDPSAPHGAAPTGFLAWWRKRRAGAAATPHGSDRAVTGEHVPVAPLQFRSAALTDAGCVRSGNEDAVRVVHLRDGAVVAVLCDGMGGHAAGEVASELAVTTILAQADRLGTPDALLTAVAAANATIRTAVMQDATLAGMGTTCVVLRLHGQSALCVHVGDSRAYLVRDCAIHRLTQDHSHVQRLVNDGTITEQDARHHPEKNVILRALGPLPLVEATAWPAPLGVRAGDRFLLSSDGLHDLADDVDLLPALAHDDAASACRALVALAHARGAPDNVSVCVVDVLHRDGGAA